MTSLTLTRNIFDNQLKLHYKNTSLNVNTLEVINEDQKLVEEVKADLSKFSLIYDKYFTQIYRYVLRRIEDVDAAQDIVSQTFFDALNNMQRFEYRGLPFVAWLYKIAHNNTLKYLKKNSRNNIVDLEEVRDLKNTENVADSAMKLEQKAVILKAMEQLEEEDREIIRLKYFEEASNIEIAEVMGITANNVGVKLFRALKRLKVNLNI